MIAPLVPTKFTIPAIFIFVALFYAVLTAVQQRYNKALRNIPGPELAKWTNLWRFFNVLRGDTHLDLLNLHRKHGKMVRIGPNVVSVSEPTVIPMIYDTKGTFHKTAFYPPESITWEKRVQPNIFSVTDETVHTEMKRKVAFAYTPESLLKMEGQIDDCGRLLMAKLDEVAKSGRAFDLGEWLHYYSGCHHASGIRLGLIRPCSIRRGWRNHIQREARVSRDWFRCRGHDRCRRVHDAVPGLRGSDVGYGYPCLSIIPC